MRGRWTDEAMAIFEAVAEPVIVHDGDTVLWANAGARDLVGRPLGTLTDVEMISSSRYPGDGAKERMIAVIRRPAADTEKQDRLELLSTISAGLAHDLNGPLAVMTLQLSALANELRAVAALAGEVGDRRGAEIATALNACRRSHESLDEVGQYLTRVVRDFGRLARAGDRTAPRATDVRHAVEIAARFTRSVVTNKAKLELDIKTDAIVAMSESNLVRVLMNLIVNAGNAFSTAAPVHNRVTVRVGRTAAGIIIDVVDNAGGVPRDVPLFGPFATGRRDGKTPGLGLAVARALLREAGGDLELAETGPGGSTFRCTIRSS